MCKYPPTDYDEETDCDEVYNPNKAWEQQDYESDEEYQERLDDWNDMVDILND